MKIISWNLLHRTGATLDEVVRLVEREEPDLLVMQEVTEPIDALPEIVGGQYARNPLPGRLHGLAAWSRRPFSEQPVTLHLQPGLIVSRVCQIIDLGPFTVANVHLSHGQILNRRQLRRIAQFLPPRAAVIGDCNMVGPAMLPGFRDVGPRHPTHAMGGVVQLRLDRCFARGLACQYAFALGNANSDHRPIIVRLAVPAHATQAA